MKDRLKDSDDSNNPNKKMRTETSQPGDTAAATATKDNDGSSKGTLYITIGPQCAGKTTVLKEIFGTTTTSCKEGKIGKEEDGMANNGGVDITIDDQALVYIPVPNDYFLDSASTSTNPSTNAGSAATTGSTIPSSSLPSSSSSSSQPSMLDETIMGKTIRERIADPSNEEMVLVLQRMGGIIDAVEFQLRLLRAGGNINNSNHNNNNNNNKNNNNNDAVVAAGETSKTTAKEDLVQVVEEIINRSKAEGSSDDNNNDNNGSNDQGIDTVDRVSLVPEKIDLFIVESIFRPRPLSSTLQTMSQQPQPQQQQPQQKNGSSSPTTTTMSSSALDEAHRLLATHASDPRIHPHSSPLAWGNTNTRPREYEKALHAAEASGRPVEFIVFGGREVCEAMVMGGSSSKSNGEHGEQCEESEKMEESNDRAKDENDVEEINNETNTVVSGVDEDRIESIQRLPTCFLPKVDRRTLLKRNLRRLLATGRYIPCGAVDDAMGRVESLLTSASSSSSSAEYQKQTKGVENEKEEDADSREGNMTRAKFRLDYELARMAGYRMNDDKTVCAMQNGSSTGNNNNNNNNYGRNGNHRNNHNNNRNHNGRNNNRRNGRGDDHRRRGRHDPSDGNYGGRGRREHGIGSGRGSYGGRSYDSRSHNNNNNNDWNRNGGQERYYDDRGRGYDDHRGGWRESERGPSSDGYYRSRREDGGNYHSGGRGRDDDRLRSSGGRGGRYRSGGRGQGRWGD